MKCRFVVPFICFNRAAQVSMHQLEWTASSFSDALIAMPGNPLADNLLAACKCHGLPSRRGRSKKTKQNKVQAEDSDSVDSADSLLDSLARAMDAFDDDHDYDDDKNDALDKQKKESEDQEGDAPEVKIKKLADQVERRDKYKSSAIKKKSVEKASLPASSSSCSAAAEKLREMQVVESAVGAKVVKEAIKTLNTRTQDRVSTDTMQQILKGSSASNPLLTEEEVAEDCVAQLALMPELMKEPTGPTGVPKTSANGPLSDPHHALVRLWAQQLLATADSFHKHEENMFTRFDSMGMDFHRCISLVHFVEDAKDLASAEAGPSGEETASTVSFVHWDRPVPNVMRGRKLRIEKGRFVWKPPASVIDGQCSDDLAEAFAERWAQIIIADCGATLVKAKGQFRPVV